ncbi:MAG: hypothetical protein KAT48_01185 [Bacteroidales bacterium]|nr:hypothetical protein [Bacteroidales bacterium]
MHKIIHKGIGKGVTIADVGKVSTRCRPKVWYSKVFFSEVKKLGSILAEKYARKANMMIIENVDDNALRWVGYGV